MIVEGTVRNGMIVPECALALPEGTRVQIEIASEPVPGAPAKRQGGWWRGRVQIADDFNELPPDIANAFGSGDA